MLLFGLFICFYQSCIFSMVLSCYSFDYMWFIILSEDRVLVFFVGDWILGGGEEGGCQLFKLLVFLVLPFFLKINVRGLLSGPTFKKVFRI